MYDGSEPVQGFDDTGNLLHKRGKPLEYLHLIVMYQNLKIVFE